MHIFPSFLFFLGLVFYPAIFIFTFGMYRQLIVYIWYSWFISMDCACGLCLWLCVDCVYGYVFELCLWLCVLDCMGICMDIGS